MSQRATDVAPNHRFPKTLRLRKRTEFTRIQNEGRRQNTPHFVILSRPSAHESARLGITTSRKVGNAPARNRVRRLVREFFRRHASTIRPPLDIVVIARSGTETLGYADVVRELSKPLEVDLVPPRHL